MHVIPRRTVMPRLIFLWPILPLLASCQSSVEQIPQWTTYKITLKARNQYDNPYTDVDMTDIEKRWDLR